MSQQVEQATKEIEEHGKELNLAIAVAVSEACKLRDAFGKDGDHTFVLGSNDGDISTITMHIKDGQILEVNGDDVVILKFLKPVPLDDEPSNGMQPSN